MENFLNKIFLRSNNLDSLSRDIKDLTLKSPAKKIFEVINSFNTESEIRYVGGCIRKIICKEKIDDIDMATNLEPDLICEALKKANIAYKFNQQDCLKYLHQIKNKNYQSLKKFFANNQQGLVYISSLVDFISSRVK